MAVADWCGLQDYPVTDGAAGTIGATGATAITLNVRAVYARVAPSASTLEKQKASRLAAPAVADDTTTRWPLHAPEEPTAN
jgi:hypothetical protein